LFALGFSAGAAAHTTSTGLATVTVEGRAVTWRLTVALGELPEEPARLIARAADGDQASAARVADSLRQHLRVASASGACRSGRFQVQGSRGGDDRAALQVAFACAEAPRKLTLSDSLTEVFGDHYRSIVSVIGPDGTRSERVFEAGSREASFDLVQPGAEGWGSFVALGAEHILTGWDHLLFLAALLIGAAGLWRVLAIVTAFTVAHSVTLALAVLQVVVIPAAVIEPAIAASIVWVALENLFASRASARRWLVSLAFGLVHGFGFAGALSEIGLSGWPLARALIGFNLGVEAGQAAAVVLFAPLFAWLARRPQARRYASVLSALLALAGAGWFVERLLA
jgi:hypothetical protein